MLPDICNDDGISTTPANGSDNEYLVVLPDACNDTSPQISSNIGCKKPLKSVPHASSNNHLPQTPNDVCLQGHTTQIENAIHRISQNSHKYLVIGLMVMGLSIVIISTVVELTLFQPNGTANLTNPTTLAGNPTTVNTPGHMCAHKVLNHSYGKTSIFAPKAVFL